MRKAPAIAPTTDTMTPMKEPRDVAPLVDPPDAVPVGDAVELLAEPEVADAHDAELVAEAVPGVVVDATTEDTLIDLEEHSELNSLRTVSPAEDEPSWMMQSTQDWSALLLELVQTHDAPPPPLVPQLYKTRKKNVSPFEKTIAKKEVGHTLRVV